MTTYRTYVLHDGYDTDPHPGYPHPRPTHSRRKRRWWKPRHFRSTYRPFPYRRRRHMKGRVGLDWGWGVVFAVALVGMIWFGQAAGIIHIEALDEFLEGDSASVSVDAPALVQVGTGNAEWTAEMTAELHRLVNLERAERIGLTLEYDADLEAIAQAHSDYMGANSHFSHTDVEGRGPTERALDFDYTCETAFTVGVGENIHRGALWYERTAAGRLDYLSVPDLAARIVQSWMDSKGHRANILDWRFRSQGFGIHVAHPERVYTTQNFC